MTNKLSSTKVINFTEVRFDFDPNKILFAINPFTNEIVYETFKLIKNYEYYEISNFGRVKSLERYVKHRYSVRIVKEKILKSYVDSEGYLTVRLSKTGKAKTCRIHQLVAVVFLNHIPNGRSGMVVNHKDIIKLNNFEWNLEIVTQRENSNKKHLKSTSKYVGVSWIKRDKKWQSHVMINGKQKYLGRFDNEYDAHLAYQNELKLIDKS